MAPKNNDLRHPGMAVPRLFGWPTLILVFSLLAGCDSGNTDDSHLAASWTVSIGAPANSAACFRPGQALPLLVDVRDGNGVALPNDAITLSGDAASLIEQDGVGGWFIIGEGSRDLSVAYNGDMSSSSTIAPVTLRLRSDSTPPQISGVTPVRSDMIVSSFDIQVQAAVSDTSSALASITVNGEEQLTASDRQDWSIDTAPPGQWGLNTVRIVASDDCDNTTRLTQSYLRSEEYLQAATAENPGSRVPNGHGIRYGQETIDDGDRGDLDDLATLVERYLERNLNPALGPATAGTNLFSQNGAFCDWITRVDLGGPGVSVTDPAVSGIDLIENGLRHRLRMSSVRVPIVVRTRVYNPLNCASVESAVTASVLFDMTATAVTTSTVTNGVVEMQSGSPSVAISNVSVTLTGNTTIDSLLSSQLSNFTGYASDAIEEILRDELPAIDEMFLNPLLAQTLTLSGDGYGFDVNLISQIDSQSITPTALTQGAFTQTFPSAAVPPGVDQGAILRPIASAGFDAAIEPLTYAINDNTINSGLWALWYGGSFVFDDILGMPGARVGFIPTLPPVMMPGSTDDESVLALGDLMVELELELPAGLIPGIEGSVVVDAYVSQYLAGTLGYSDARRDKLRLAINPDASDTFVEFLAATLNGERIEDPDLAASVDEYAEGLIAAATGLMLNDSLAAVSLPPVTIEFDEGLTGGAVTSMELTVQQVRDVADGILVDVRLEAESVALPREFEWISMNHRWTDRDFLDQSLLFPVDYPENDPATVTYPWVKSDGPHRTTVGEYRDNLDACDADGEFEGKKRCLPSWEEPLNYGWYCGGGRPVDGWIGENRVLLDPVDQCCQTHDRNLFDPELAALSPLNACGFAMCLHKARASAADIFDLMPNVERARINMYNRAALLCSGPGAALDILAKPVGDPLIGSEPL